MVTSTDAMLRLEPWPDLGAAREEWSALAEDSGNIFATWEWASTWWRHFSEGRRLLATGCRRGDGSLIAILPLFLSGRKPLRTLRFLGGGPGDVLGPICHPDDSKMAVSALADALRDDFGEWDVFLAERVPRQGFAEALGGTVLQQEACPVLRIGGRKWDDFLASCSANLRQQIRRRERQLARAHNIRYRLAEDPARLPEDLNALYRLHGARWGGPDAGNLRDAAAAFHRDFATLALERGWLRLWLLEVEDVPVAAWYGFRFAGTEWYYQAGRDPAWDRHSVGFVLLVHSIRAAFEDGMHTYAFLRGDEPFKRRFATEDPGIETLAVSRGPLGRASVAAASAARRLPPGLRRRLVRYAG